MAKMFGSIEIEMADEAHDDISNLVRSVNTLSALEIEDSLDFLRRAVDKNTDAVNRLCKLLEEHNGR